jgi:formate dehydrogenase subunit gamma
LNTEENVAVATAIATHQAEPGGLLPLLHALQDSLGYVPSSALPTIGKAMNLSRAEVHGVVTFYPHFRQTAAGRHVIRICQAEACQSMGADELTRHAILKLGIDLHESSGDGRYTLEPVYCLGNCACSPAMMIGDDLHGRVDADSFDRIVGELDHGSQDR